MSPEEAKALAARLESLRAATGGGSWRAFAERVGVSGGYFTAKLTLLRRGEGSSIGGEELDKLLAHAREMGHPVDSSWILHGKGSGIDDEPPAPPIVSSQLEGRWRIFAERYAGFRAVATFRQQEEGVPDHVLDSASDSLGLQKSDAGPTEEESDAAIDRWLRRRPSKEAGRAATASDFGRPEKPSTRPPSARRGRARPGS